MNSIAFTFLSSVLLLSTLQASALQSSIRGSRSLILGDVLCRVVSTETLHESEDGASMYTTEDPSCVPIIDGDETDHLISLASLPVDVQGKDKEEIVLLSITNAEYSEDYENILVTDQSQYSFMYELPEHLRHLTERRLEEDYGNGEKTVAILRVSTSDSSPTATRAELNGLLNPNNVNFISQFDKCSRGNLSFKKASRGVIEVTVGQPIADFGTKSGGALATAAINQVKADLGISSMTEIADRVMLSLPPGTGTWVAVAPMRHWRTVFNDSWVTSLSAAMHELGHNSGLSHAYEDGIKYADTTGYMSRSFRSTDGPLRCYNGQQNDMLGWFDERKMSFNPISKSGPTLVRLAAFVDIDQTNPNEPVLVNVADTVYLQYNVARSFNSGTGEKANSVTITEKSSQGSELLSGLTAGNTFEIDDFNSSGKQLSIEVCQIEARDSTNPEIAVVSIGIGKTNCDEYQPPAEVEAKEKESDIVAVREYVRNWIDANRPVLSS